MKTSIFFFCLILFFSSCKRESPVPENLPEINLMKAWYVKKVNPQTLQKANILDGNEKILWDKSVYSADNNYFEIPILNNRNFLNKFSKKLIIQRITDSDYKGRIEVVLSKETLVMNTPVLQKNFTGAVINYNLNENNYSSIHYSNGEITNNTEKLEPKASTQTSNPDPNNPPPPSCEGSQVCIDWYWQTFINGELVDEVYLYTTCSCGDSGGGGPGGGGILTCEQQLFNFTAQGSVENGPVTTVDISNNGTIWDKMYNWVIFKALTWGIMSYERGTLEKVHYSNGDRWEFQNFEHVRMTGVGTSIGGTRTFEDIGPTINISATRMKVDLRVDFTVTSKVTSCVPPLVIPYNANKTFYAPNIIVILPPE